MKNYKEVQVTNKELVSITCDCCKVEHDDIMEIQEFLHYVNDAGYSSIMGDGNRLRLDLCQHCVKKLLGDFIRIEGNYIWDGTKHASKMDPKHDHLNELLSEHSNFKDEKPE